MVIGIEGGVDLDYLPLQAALFGYPWQSQLTKRQSATMSREHRA